MIDYYAILNISPHCSITEIKNAYKKQALKWHPDVNKTVNANNRMQLINEAYLILKDFEARKRYDVEYLTYLAFKKREIQKKHKDREKNYKIQDEVLVKWMKNAQKQAVEMINESIEDALGMLKSGLNNLVLGIKGFIIIIVFLLLFSLIMKMV
jgi:curved DNA-binding protein CbpA